MGDASLATLHEPARTMTQPLRPAAMAFDAIALTFDLRFGAWHSVAAQRHAVPTTLLPRDRWLDSTPARSR